MKPEGRTARLRDARGLGMNARTFGSRFPWIAGSSPWQESRAPHTFTEVLPGQHTHSGDRYEFERTWPGPRLTVQQKTELVLPSLREQKTFAEICCENDTADSRLRKWRQGYGGSVQETA